MNDGDSLFWLVIAFFVALIVYAQQRKAVPASVINVIGKPIHPSQIGNKPALLALQQGMPTKPLSQRIVVPTAGTPKRLPSVKVAGRVQISTIGNTGAVYLAPSYLEAADTLHRFAIGTGQNIDLPFEVKNLRELWLDAATDNDGISIFCQIESPGG